MSQPSHNNLQTLTVSTQQVNQVGKPVGKTQRKAVDGGRAILKQAMAVNVPKQELFNMVLISVARAFADMNVKETSEADRDYLVNELTDNIIKYYPAIRLSEIPDAVALGIRGKYGPFYGLSVVTFEGFISAYLYSEKRTCMVRELPVNDDEPRQPPSMESQFETATYNTLQALQRKQNKRDLEVTASSVYNFLDKLKLMNFTTDEKYDMLADAVRSLIAELQFKLTISRMSERAEIKKDMADLKLSITQRVALNDRLICLAKLRAKALALDAFLSNVILEDIDLAALITSRKKLFLEG